MLVAKRRWGLGRLGIARRASDVRTMEIFCGLLSSSTVKSDRFKPSMGVPVLGSFTVTSTITRLALVVKTLGGRSPRLRRRLVGRLLSAP